MPLATPKTQTSNDDLEDIPEVPPGIQRDRWDRPLIVPAAGGPPVAYTRASTLGKAIEDTYHLSKWLQRSVAYGLSRRPDLIALVASIATNEGADRGPLDELCEKAHEAARGNQGANVGTAIHKLSERVDAGEDLSYLPAELLEAIEAYRHQMRIFEVLATETFVACDMVQAAGTFDRMVRLLVDLHFRHPVHGDVVIPAGTILIVDLKTGKAESAKYWGPTYGVQQAVYQGGDPYTASGRITWEQLLGPGLVPSDEWAILLHVPSDSPKDAGLVVVDLTLGREMADLCLEIRNARRNKGLMSDAYPVEAIETAEDVETPTPGVEDVAATTTAEIVLDLIQAATAEVELNDLWEDYQPVWTDEHTEAAKQRISELASVADVIELEVANDLGEVLLGVSAAGPSTEQQVQAAHQARKLGLIASIRHAANEQAIEAMWASNQDIWDDDATRMVKARLAELGAAP